MHGIDKAKKQARATKIAMQEKQNIPKPKLVLATRDYTPTRTRVDDEGIHERLYKIGMEKASAKEFEEYYLKMKREACDTSKVSKSNKKVISRLYQRSKIMQEEGRAKREMIEQKLSPRAQTPSRKIPLDRATEMYRRGMKYKVDREKRLDEAKATNTSVNLLRSRSALRSREPSRRDPVPHNRASTPTARQMRSMITTEVSEDSFRNWRLATDAELSSRSHDKVGLSKSDESY